MKEITKFLKQKNYIEIIKEEKNITDNNNKSVKRSFIFKDFKKFLENDSNRNFIINLINDEKIINSDLCTFFIKNLIETSDINEIDELIKFLISNEKIYKNNICHYDDKNPFDNILIYAALNNYNFNYEHLIIKILREENIVNELLNSDNGAKLFGGISIFSVYNYYLNSNIMEEMFKNKNILQIICNDESFQKFFGNLPNVEYKKAFDIYFKNEFIAKINTDNIIICFNYSIYYEKIDILTKLLNTTSIEKIPEKHIFDCFSYLCKYNKTEIIDLLINNEIILNKILKNPDNKLIECFKITCDNKNKNIIRLLLNKKEIEEKIGADKIKEEIQKMSFLEICNIDDISVAKEFIMFKPDILTKEIINKLNKDENLLLYNVLNNKYFNEADIKIAEILITKGLEINKTNKIVRRNINTIIENLNKKGYNIKKQHFGIIDNRKLKRTKEAIKNIKEFINIKKLTDDISNISLVNNNEKTIN